MGDRPAIFASVTVVLLLVLSAPTPALAASTSLTIPQGVHAPTNTGATATLSGSPSVFPNATFSQREVSSFGTTGLSDPEGVAVDKNGSVYVVDRFDGRVVKYDASGKQLASFPVTTTTPPASSGQTGLAAIAVDDKGYIYLADSTNLGGGGFIWKLAPNGTVLLKWGVPGQHFDELGGLTVDNKGFVYLAVTWTYGPSSGVTKYSGNGTMVAQWMFGAYGNGNPYYRPKGIFYGSDGYLYLAGQGLYDPKNNWDFPPSIIRLDPNNGGVKATWTLNRTAFPDLIGVAPGASGSVLAADPSSEFISSIDTTTGKVSTFSSLGQFAGPTWLASGSRGQFYVSNSYMDQVDILASSGTVTRAFGQSRLYGNIAVAVDSKGAVYTADGGSRLNENLRISKFDPNGSLLARWAVSVPGDDYNEGYFTALQVDGAGNVYSIVNPARGYCCVWMGKYDQSGKLHGTLSWSDWGAIGSTDTSGDTLVLTSGKVLEYDSALSQVGNWTAPGSARGIAAYNGAVFILVGDASYETHVLEYTRGGSQILDLPVHHDLLPGVQGASNIDGLGKLAMDHQGYFYLIDYSTGSVLRMSPSGSIIGQYGIGCPRGMVAAGADLLYLATDCAPTNVGVHLYSTALVFSSTIRFALAENSGSLPASLIPGIPATETVTLTNVGTMDAYFLFAIAIPSYMNVTGIRSVTTGAGGYGTLSAVATSPYADIIGLDLKPGEPVPVLVTLTLNPNAVFAAGSLLTPHEAIASVEAVQYAMLPTSQWQNLLSSGLTSDQLVTRALNESLAYEWNFLQGLRAMSASDLTTAINTLNGQDPDLATYIAFTLYKQQSIDPIASYADSLPLPSAPSRSPAPPKPPPSTGLEAPVGYSSWGAYFANVFDPVQFAETEDASLCGFATAPVQVFTGGLVRFNSNNQYFNIGKNIGYSWIAAEALAVGAGSAAGLPGGSIGVGGVQLNILTPATTSAVTPAIGVELEAGGTVGNILKVAYNFRQSAFPYIGIWNTFPRIIPGVTTLAGNSIAGTLIHYYLDGTISPFVPGAGYVTMYGPGLYQLPIISQVLPGIYDHYVTNINTNDPWNIPPPITHVVVSGDPNYMDADPTAYLRSLGHPLTFGVGFENLPNASANAINVKVVIHLDKSLNASTVKLISTSAPANLALFGVTSKNTLTAVFSDLNLPPDKTPPQGRGWLTFSVFPNGDVSQGAKLDSNASVYFDSNPAVNTNHAQQIYDSVPPKTSATVSLSANDSLSVKGVSVDNGSGPSEVMVTVVGYNASDSVKLNLTSSGSFETSFQLVAGQKYSVFAVGTDKAGNVENKTSPDAVVSAPSTATSTSTSISPSSSSSSTSSASSGSNSLLLPTAAVLVVVVVLAFGIMMRRRKPPAPPPPSLRRDLGRTSSATMTRVGR